MAKKIKLLLVVDAHLVKTPDGKVWSSTIYDYNFFARYLSVFDEVRIVTRIKDSDDNNGYPKLCSGDRLEFFQLPDYRGPKEYIKKYRTISRNARKCFEDCDCAIFRVPSSIGYRYAKLFKKTKKPYALEVVIDPWDFAAPGTMDNKLRPLIRIIWTHDLKQLCLKANGVSYVTKYALQNRYPSYSRKHGSDKRHFEEYYSSIDLPNSYFQKHKKIEEKNYIDIVHVSNAINNYVKGHEEIIQAIAKLNNDGIKAEVTFIGDGDLVDHFMQEAETLGVKQNVHFIGKISSKEQLQDEILKHDMFIFPSHAEGLPRALIEAMALGMPCIATNINGIPELLDEDYLVEVGHVDDLKKKINYLYSDINIAKTAGIKNIETAKQYADEILSKRRTKFYNCLRKISESEN